jgi:hypothetical protein
MTARDRYPRCRSRKAMLRIHERERIIPAKINKSTAAKKQEAISGALIRASPDQSSIHSKHSLGKSSIRCPT